MKILFAGGGTGGHLYPAIAIAEEVLKKVPDAYIAFVGTRDKIEARVIPQKGFRFFTIWISGFSRRLRIGNLLFPIKVVVAMIQSFLVIKKMKPGVVVGTGGYVCGPVLFAASVLGVKTVIHESNSFPGVTTRLLARRVTKVIITFEDSRRWISPEANIELIGNPTRAELSEMTRSEGSRYYGLDERKKTIFVFGGSLGAASINAAMPALTAAAIKNDFQIIWQTGSGQKMSESSQKVHPNIKVFEYIDRMDCAYAASDLVVSRAGATTIAELTRIGKPAVLVPYPYAAANHQELNAQTIAEKGAAVIVQDTDLQQRLLPVVLDLVNDERALQEMQKQSLALGNPAAGEQIAERIIAL